MGEDVNESEKPQREQVERRGGKPSWKIKEISFLRGHSFAADCVSNIAIFVNSKFDIFASKPVQESVHETAEVVYKSIEFNDQS